MSVRERFPRARVKDAERRHRFWSIAETSQTRKLNYQSYWDSRCFTGEEQRNWIDLFIYLGHCCYTRSLRKSREDESCGTDVCVISLSEINWICAQMEESNGPSLARLDCQTHRANISFLLQECQPNFSRQQPPTRFWLYDPQITLMLIPTKLTEMYFRIIKRSRHKSEHYFEPHALQTDCSEIRPPAVSVRAGLCWTLLDWPAGHRSVLQPTWNHISSTSHMSLRMRRSPRVM